MTIATIIGFTATVFFSARTILQWIYSEKAGDLVSPTIYWIFSILGSYLMFIYGWLRLDFAILLGQVISYYIYLWNLNLKGAWKRLHSLTKLILALTPPIIITLSAANSDIQLGRLFHNSDIPLGLLIYGSAGQLVFTLRFVYQWLHSLKVKRSDLDPIFWIISLSGSIIIISYALVRKDPVLIVSQSFGLAVYVRNIIIGLKHHENHERLN